MALMEAQSLGLEVSLGVLVSEIRMARRSPLFVALNALLEDFSALRVILPPFALSTVPSAAASLVPRLWMGYPYRSTDWASLPK